jgi:hypothetical protein
MAGEWMTREINNPLSTQSSKYKWTVTKCHVHYIAPDVCCVLTLQGHCDVTHMGIVILPTGALWYHPHGHCDITYRSIVISPRGALWYYPHGHCNITHRSIVISPTGALWYYPHGHCDITHRGTVSYFPIPVTEIMNVKFDLAEHSYQAFSLLSVRLTREAVWWWVWLKRYRCTMAGEWMMREINHLLSTQSSEHKLTVARCHLHYIATDVCCVLTLFKPQLFCSVECVNWTIVLI